MIIDNTGKNLTVGSFTNFINVSNNEVHILAVASEKEKSYLNIKTNLNITNAKTIIVITILNIKAK